ncbi:SRPBCC family protein [Acidipila sp. EB88]|uniref:SRPBCC family protein n=1 Tax=Acidipila sp. EB88 TaxID=2305226 RepID=UPI001315A577|nr:SRPBCC family protein [Acidipila sp. EB88]
MIQTDVKTPLDPRTRLSAAPGFERATAQSPTQKAVQSPLVYAALVSAVYLFRKQIFSPGGLLFAAGVYVARSAKTQKLAGTLQQASRGLVQEQATFTIAKPADELYAKWLDIATAPSYQESIHSVTVTGEDTSHWVMDLPGGQTLEWDAEWTAKEPGKRLAWRSIGDTPVPSAGQVSFEPAVSGRGTVVRVNQEFLLPGGKLAAALGGLVSRTPGGFVKENLRHFKQLAETGEIPTTRGQSHGTRSAGARVQQAFTGDREQQPTVPQTGGIAHEGVAQ